MKTYPVVVVVVVVVVLLSAVTYLAPVEIVIMLLS